MNNGKTPVYIYIDEAGNFDFSPKGSKYLILTCAVMNRPFKHVMNLAAIKYDCLEHGLNAKHGGKCQEFHAAEDWQRVRDRVFGVIGNITGLHVYSVIIRKNMTNPSLRPPEKIYARAFDWLIEDVRKGEEIDESNLVVTVTDSINFKGKNDALRVSLMRYMEEEFTCNGIESRLYQHQSSSDFNLQVVDYCSWAIQRKWEKSDARSYDLIKPMVMKEGDIFKWGDTIYYKYSRL